MLLVTVISTHEMQSTGTQISALDVVTHIIDIIPVLLFMLNVRSVLN